MEGLRDCRMERKTKEWRDRGMEKYRDIGLEGLRDCGMERKTKEWRDREWRNTGT